MKVLVPKAQIAADKQTLSFTLDLRGQTVTCVAPRKCLEVFFWLPPDADDARMACCVGDEWESCRIIRVAQDEPTKMSRRLRKCIAPPFQTARCLARRAVAAKAYSTLPTCAAACTSLRPMAGIE
jgi:hypothetical protein